MLTDLTKPFCISTHFLKKRSANLNFYAISLGITSLILMNIWRKKNFCRKFQRVCFGCHNGNEMFWRAEFVLGWWGGVCKFIFMSDSWVGDWVVLMFIWGFDNKRTPMTFQYFLAHFYKNHNIYDRIRLKLKRLWFVRT